MEVAGTSSTPDAPSEDVPMTPDEIIASRKALNDEFIQLRDQIDSIVNNANFT